MEDGLLTALVFDGHQRDRLPGNRAHGLFAGAPVLAPDDLRCVVAGRESRGAPTSQPLLDIDSLHHDRFDTQSIWTANPAGAPIPVCDASKMGNPDG